MVVSLIVLLRGFPCFHDFSHDASHPYIPIHSMILAHVPHIAATRTCVDIMNAP